MCLASEKIAMSYGDGLLWLPLRRESIPDWCPSALETQNLLGFPFPGEMCLPAAAPIFRGPNLGGKVYGGFRLVVSLRGGARLSSAPIIPGDRNFPRDPPLGVVEYGVWGPVLQAPAQGPPTIAGGFLPPLPRLQPPPLYPQTEFLPIPANDPHLPAPIHASEQ